MVATTTSLMFVHTRTKVQFTPNIEMPLLGIAGTAGLGFQLLGLQHLTLPDAVMMFVFDHVLAALVASFLLGTERRKLHLQFIKFYVALLLILPVYFYGDVLDPASAMKPTGWVLFELGRFLIVGRSIYVKWTYARFGDAPEVVTPNESGGKFDVLLGKKLPEAPRVHRFKLFPTPVLETLDAIFDSGLCDDIMHGAGRYGTTDLYVLSEWVFSLPVAALMCFNLEFERLPFGLQAPYYGPVGGVPTSHKLSMVVQNEAAAWSDEADIPDNERFYISTHARLYVFILTVAFCIVRLVIPSMTARWLFDRGSSVHSWAMMPLLMYAPAFCFGVLNLGQQDSAQETSRLRLVCGFIASLICAMTRRGLYGVFRRKRFLLKTAQLRYSQPSVLRATQIKSMTDFMSNLSTEDYGQFLLDTTVHRGANLKALAIHTGLLYHDARPAATAAWKLAASLVRRGVRMQKRIEKKEVDITVGVVVAIREWVYQMAEAAVDQAGGHGKRMQLCTVFAKQKRKLFAFKRLVQLVEKRRLSRAKRQKGLFSTAPIVIATAAGTLRPLDCVTYPAPMTISENRTDGIFSVAKCIQSGHIPTPLSVVFTFGNRVCGALGDSNRSSDVMSVDSLRGKDLVQVEAGPSATFVMSSKGKLWGFGSNRGLNLGMRKEITQVDTPMRIKSLRDVDLIQVSMAKSGQGHSLVLTQSGEVFVFGTSYSGALGVAGTKQTGPKCLPLAAHGLNQVKIKQIATGAKHSLFLTTDGQIYSCGENVNGQLGLGKPKGHDVDRRWIVPVFEEPQLIRLTDVKWMVAGDNHNFALAESQLYAWGANASGQLGIGRASDALSPSLVAMDDVESVACGANHSLIVSGGRLWSCGSNSHGQLGHNEDIRGVNLPTLVTGVQRPIDVAAAVDHSFCIDQLHHCWAFGNNDEGQLSWDPAKNKIILRPTIVSALCHTRVHMVSTSGSHTIVLCSSKN
eukprot:GEMP01004848.1.p1 GENE.GEMP01004848.1~~GEMP01004848.1.p1  ORF type:complete len:966 (+),score=191.19 GEMP01004848.1:747-3644(+)